MSDFGIVCDLHGTLARTRTLQLPVSPIGREVVFRAVNGSCCIEYALLVYVFDGVSPPRSRSS